MRVLGTGLIARALRDAADRLDPLPPPPAPLPTDKRELIHEDTLDEMRRAHALSLLDPECHGYLMIQLREDEHGKLGLLPEHVMPHIAWPAVTDLLLQLADEAMNR